MNFTQTTIAALSLALLTACNDPAPPNTADAAPTAAPPARPVIQRSNAALAQAIDSAAWTATYADAIAERNALLRVQVLLDRAHFSPGVIDGRDGGNLRNAIAAYEAANELPEDGLMDAEVWSRLARDDRPTVTDYVITAQDAQGPYVAVIPEDYAEMSKLPALSYASAAEALAERFHMDEDLLRALNPGVDFAVAGNTILVAANTPEPLAAKAARIEVDKAKLQVRAYGRDDALLAVYPATVGSAERPAPSGTWAVKTLAPAPTYTFDPSRLTFGKKSDGKLTIAAGPNNPVGGTWIDLTKDTYGIHGTPDPKLVGKVASHGCVRLTNWDAHQLGQAVEQGTKVVFAGSEARAS